MRVALPQLVGFASVALLRFRQSRVKPPKLSRRQGLHRGAERHGRRSRAGSGRALREAAEIRRFVRSRFQFLISNAFQFSIRRLTFRREHG